MFIGLALGSVMFKAWLGSCLIIAGLGSARLGHMFELGLAQSGSPRLLSSGRLGLGRRLPNAQNRSQAFSNAVVF